MSATVPDRDRSLFKALLIGFGLSWLIALTLLLLTAALALAYAVQWATPRLTAFTEAANTTLSEALVTGAVGWTTTPKQTDQRTNILLLGLDSLATRGDAKALTDTMLIVSVNVSSGQINTLPIPRDTWDETYATRMNALYFYGLEKDPKHPERWAARAISEKTGIPLHHTVVITLEQLGQLIDLVGGVTITVPEGFVDPLFPRTDVDVTVERDPAKLYETVEFVAGEQTMSGERALKYIRSRKSQGDTGGDGARTLRQQQVIQALLTKLTATETISDPRLLGQLYAYYQQTFSRYIPVTQGIALAKALLPYKNDLRFSGHSLSIYPDDSQGVLTHPDPRGYNGQWLYVIRDPALFQAEIKQKLNVP